MKKLLRLIASMFGGSRGSQRQRQVYGFTEGDWQSWREVVAALAETINDSGSKRETSASGMQIVAERVWDDRARELRIVSTLAAPKGMPRIIIVIRPLSPGLSVTRVLNAAHMRRATLRRAVSVFDTPIVSQEAESPQTIAIQLVVLRYGEI